MLQWHWLKNIGISRRDFCILFTLLFNAFTWFFMTLIVMESIPTEPANLSAFRAIFYIAAIGSAISGSLFSEKIRRVHFLYLWIGFGIVSSFFLIPIYSITAGHFSIIFLLLGISFGLGMPSSLACLADYTHLENRGRISAVILLAVNLFSLPLAILFMSYNLVVNSIILTVWRGLGLVLLVFLKPETKKFPETSKRISFTSLFHDRTFVLYLIPWLMFCIIDTAEKALFGDFIGPDFLRFILTIEPIIASVFIFVGGLLSDRIGRKRVVIYGFVSLGIAYAIIGIAPMMTMAWYFYIAIDGIATGILWIIFILIVWGDLSQHGAREKYYAVGSFPFFARSIIPLFLFPFITLVPTTAAFSLASFFLFLAVLPLMYAPETLPEKKMEIRRLKGYVEQAKKFTEKYTKKNGNKS